MHDGWLYAVIAILALTLALVIFRARSFSFVAQRPEHYADTGPTFDPRTLLNGVVRSEGMIYGPTGRVTSRFVMQMHGRWDGPTGILTEDFTYATGRTQHREWTLVQQGDGRLSATAPDIIGEGEGIVSGSSLRLSYRIRLPDDVGGHVLDVVDWLYLMPNGMILNRSQMRRFGITLAELVASMRPEDPPQTPLDEAHHA
ncbi:DUF3833 domain-containing protein [Rhodalgimonas zhirmunskyi]|uniref:DUF3833 domain-containing protein n=1 Tax=Rhodalgimonas zhirmunskyi TaxID=2964767 RepID=A0AAJ1U9X2_9RHOB|nr:DUF3833 domain-containing protein [Rhodoalgimonas zhirmunskyi]MDQ2095480.1 DUF3833 domain-containing protein [Rhodoalgimonas zhirmunskyi]